MLSIRSRFLGTALAAAALVALLGATGVSAQKQAAGTPVEAVRILLKAFIDPNTGTECNAVMGKVAGCPITLRLLDRLQNPNPAENGNIVSRSQNPPQSLNVKEIDNNGSTALVDTLWEYGAGKYGITFVVKKDAATSSWLVDDSYCTGMPATSIYNEPTGPCDVSGPTGGGPTPVATAVAPGMPSTGAGDQPASPILDLAAGALILSGMAVLGLNMLRSRARKG